MPAAAEDQPHSNNHLLPRYAPVFLEDRTPGFLAKPAKIARHLTFLLAFGGGLAIVSERLLILTFGGLK